MNRSPGLGRTPETDQLLASLERGAAGFLEGLVELIAARVAEHIQPTSTAPVKLLLTKQELAQAWSCSTSSIDRMRFEGLPTVLLGESPRFDPVAAMAWLENRGGP